MIQQYAAWIENGFGPPTVVTGEDSRLLMANLAAYLSQLSLNGEITIPVQRYNEFGRLVDQNP